MVLTIVALTPDEKFVQFLDPALCDIEETNTYGGLRTINLKYTFQDFNKDKKLFEIGNKIWVQGDENLSDCLYIVNTEVVEDIYHENQFSLELEEVLVELNYAPLFLQTELDNSEFRNVTSNGQTQTIIDWNALNYWFGDYFNMGVIQDCISTYAQRITITGTLTRMALLRQIEEETGNVFVTRYEKDILDNTIHRYLDFLNPIDVAKNWSLNLEYTFQDQTYIAPVEDAQGNPTTEDAAEQVTPFSTNLDPESVPETIRGTEPTETQTEKASTYNINDDQLYYYDTSPQNVEVLNLDPTICTFRITDGENLLNTDGEIYQDDEDTPLEWECTDAGLDTENTYSVISLCKQNNIIGMTVNSSSFAVLGEYSVDEPSAFLSELKTNDYLTILQENKKELKTIPDNSWFEIYDAENEKVLFHTQINLEIGTVHEEVLDFAYNLENITYEIDETDTYTAISPIIATKTEGENNNAEKELSRTDIATIINNWKNLSVEKGYKIPMIVQKVNVEATSLSNAKSILGEYDLQTNYWSRPLKPNDNTDSTQKTYEFYRASAYWEAPYTKNAGEFHLATTDTTATQYTDIYCRPDNRNERKTIISPKLGTTESSDEDKYMIYNQVALYLKEHSTPKVDIQVDVANLIGKKFNSYDLHDKVYVKVPDSQELITARIVETKKDAHNIASNTVKLSNYTPLNTARTITHSTFIECENTTFKYPRSKVLKARLVNAEYNADDYYSIQYPANKLLTFTVYKKDQGSSSFTGKVYTAKTDAYGYASIVMKYDPGDYDVEIKFAGDELYAESSHTVVVNVSGTIDVVPQMKKKETKAKTTTTKTTTKTKTVKTYFNKCGLTPDKKKICAVAKPSSSVSDAKYRGVSMTQWYKTIFNNKCPECGRQGTLRFDGGKANKCITSTGARGRGYKVGVPEHEITCIHCDSDFDGVTGLEKNYGHSTRLKTLKNPVKSSTTEFGKLVKGKLVYETKTETVSSKSTVDSKNRYIRASNISSKMKKLAKSIVGNSTGLTAAKKIASWVDRNISYAGYANFIRSPDTVYNKRSGNCCDGTRFLFTLLDAAGCCEYFDLYYVHVPGHVYGQIVTKKSGKKRYVDTASDYAGCWGYICRNYRGRSQTKSKYPNRPF